jgi:hypothetical protein
MTPNTYEAPVCQEATEVRRKERAFRYWVHARSIALGVTDLISNSGSTGDANGVSCTKHLSRVRPHGPLQRWPSVEPWQVLPRPRNDTVPSCRPNQSHGLTTPESRSS